MSISNLKKTWTNTALFEFGLDNFLTIFEFTLPFFKALSQDGKIMNSNNT